MNANQPNPRAAASGSTAEPTAEAEWLRVVQEKAATLRYGVVQLVVDEGRVTQIERTEKLRLGAPSAPGTERTAD
jgi:hypothetical protein